MARIYTKAGDDGTTGLLGRQPRLNRAPYPADVPTVCVVDRPPPGRGPHNIPEIPCFYSHPGGECAAAPGAASVEL